MRAHTNDCIGNGRDKDLACREVLQPHADFLDNEAIVLMRDHTAVKILLAYRHVPQCLRDGEVPFYVAVAYKRGHVADPLLVQVRENIALPLKRIIYTSPAVLEEHERPPTSVATNCYEPFIGHDVFTLRTV
ncbi:hypothetical protein NUW54_g7554 [Trametes sanguinea]|uniref:Uncharacterized protein n=1 Tax=Trametes sanguinea TaxID=158606 RepID=A0ACC1PLR1_9APHY|nr:hypothetical protein NUW54_g7554 [Trametes sanguinea]